MCYAAHFFFFGEATFLDFGDEDAELEAAGDFADFGFGAFGFFVGPALLDFFAFEGDLAFAAVDAAAVAFVVDFLSPAGDFLDFAAAVVAVLFFSAAVFFAFGEVFFAALLLGLLFSDDIARFVGDFLPLAVADFFFSAVGLAALAAADANLKDPEAPLPFVCTNVPEATDAFKYFLMKGATFSASTL